MNYNELSEEEQKLVLQHRLNKQSLDLNFKGFKLTSYINSNEEMCLCLNDTMSETGVIVNLNDEQVDKLLAYVKSVVTLKQSIKRKDIKKELSKK